MKTLIKIDRVAAWVLLAGILLYFISGYGMTKGFLSPALATKIHLDYLSYIVAIAFVCHTSFAIHLALRRWRIWNNATAALLLFFYLFFISGFIYVDLFYGKSVSKKASNELSNETGGRESQSIKQQTTPPNVGTRNEEISGQKVFTRVELAKYNGQSGNKAFVAVDGKVYDLTAVFIQGRHFSHHAGQELTSAFYSYHAKKVLAKYPIVGILEDK